MLVRQLRLLDLGRQLRQGSRERAGVRAARPHAGRAIEDDHQTITATNAADQRATYG